MRLDVLGHVAAAQPAHVRFSALAAAQPDAIAARFADQSISYRELDKRSTRLARQLGVRVGDRVGVSLAPGLDIVLAMLAIWKARAVYVPLDPSYPEALTQDLLAQLKPALVLTEETLAALHNVEPLPMELSASLLSDESHIFFTSGTTGVPKGVVATHENLAHYLDVARERYRFDARDVFCSLARYTFSISLFELMSPLVCGGSLRLLAREEVLDPPRLVEHLREVTVLHAGPSLLGSVFRYLRSAVGAPTLPNMRHASSGGDIVPMHVVDEMKRVFERAEIYVIYGCTEISCMGCSYQATREREEHANYVGVPFPGVEMFLLDADQEGLGEICFAGPGITRGYLDAELTAGKYIELDGARFYRTGDIGRISPEHGLEMFGRRDNQVQIRGVRIELLGIEQQTVSLGLAEQCVVAVQTSDEDHESRLVACLVGAKVKTLAELRQALGTRIPDYALPQRMLVLDALPVTRNGKLDRKRVRELVAESEVHTRDLHDVSGALDERIALLFATLLGLPEVGLDDDFFDCGGDSLQAVRVSQEIAHAVGHFVSPIVLFEQRTPRRLAEHIRHVVPSDPLPLLLDASAQGPAFFFVAGLTIYRELARALASDYALYGVYARSELAVLGEGASLRVEEMARDYVAAIQAQQPHGPYRIGGFSFGGLVALEVGKQLAQAGEVVERLVVLDAIFPEPGWRAKLERAARSLRAPRYMFARALQRLNLHRKPALVPDEFALLGVDELRGEAYQQAADSWAQRATHFPGRVELVVSARRLAAHPIADPYCGLSRMVRDLHVSFVDVEHTKMLASVQLARLIATKPA